VKTGACFRTFIFAMTLSMRCCLADSASDAWWQGAWLTGDWGGEREQLASDGITPYVFYTSIVAGNPIGGHEQVGPRYAQDISFGLTFDMQKLVDWDGATININGIDRFGKTIRREIGSVYDPVEIYGGQTLFLYNVTLEQKFWNDMGSFKIGRFSPGDDFATSPLYGYYVSNGIDGQIRAVIDDTRFATYPFASWAARLRFDPTPEFNIMTGVFEISDQLTNHDRHGVNFGINDQDGTQIVQQFGWTPEFAKEPVDPPASRDAKSMTSAPKSVGLPGHYFIGGYFSNSDYAQFGTDIRTRLSYGFYAHADQMVYRPSRESDTGVTIFATAAYAPQPNIAILPFQLSGGAIYQGLLPARPKDATILGVIYGNFSNDYADSVSASFGGANPTEEIDWELGYRVQFTDFAYIQPDVQVITNPGGSGTIPDAVVFGAQIGFSF